MSLPHHIGIEDLGVRDAEAVIAGGLFGTFLGGLLLTWWEPEAIIMIGKMVGVESVVGSWVVLFGVGVLLGAPFVTFISCSVDAFANRVIMLSRQNDTLRKILVPALQFSAYGVTLMGVGTIYGIILGIAFYGLAVPLWLMVLGYSVPFPFITPFTIWGWSIYGAMLGLVYGLIMES